MYDVAGWHRQLGADLLHGVGCRVDAHEVDWRPAHAEVGRGQDTVAAGDTTGPGARQHNTPVLLQTAVELHNLGIECITYTNGTLHLY